MSRKLCAAWLKVVLLSLLPLPAGLVSAEGADRQTEPVAAEVNYRVGPGDVLALQVFGEDDLSLSLTVGPEGRINVPYLDMVPVGDLTVHEIALLIDGRLRQGVLVDPQVVVRVEQYRARPVHVMGDVAKPGVYYLQGNDAILDMIARAGGAPNDPTSARVLREVAGVRQSIVVDLEGLARGEVQQGVRLQGGDTLYVDPPAQVFVSGEVKKEGAVPWRDGITVWQALTRAGGPTGTARLKGAYVLRDGQTLPIDLKAVKRGRQADMVLRPDDQVVIPESMF